MARTNFLWRHWRENSNQWTEFIRQNKNYQITMECAARPGVPSLQHMADNDVIGRVWSGMIDIWHYIAWYGNQVFWETKDVSIFGRKVALAKRQKSLFLWFLAAQMYKNMIKTLTRRPCFVQSRSLLNEKASKTSKQWLRFLRLMLWICPLHAVWKGDFNGSFSVNPVVVSQSYLCILKNYRFSGPWCVLLHFNEPFNPQF